MIATVLAGKHPQNIVEREDSDDDDDDGDHDNKDDGDKDPLEKGAGAEGEPSRESSSVLSLVPSSSSSPGDAVTGVVFEEAK